MSATIGDAGDLSRRLGTRSIEKIPVPSEYAQQTYGRRLLVMNRIEDDDIPRRLQAVILTALQIHPKSVWLCSSHSESEKVRELVLDWLNGNGIVGHPSWTLTSLGGEIDDFKRSPQGHLFVGGRFDGMDFSADECRLVVVKTLPRAINIQEDFISAYLRDSGFMRRRLNQRVVQALGRCNRAEDDYGVYVLADRRFATHFGRESNREGIPQNMIAEIDMAQDDAEVAETELIAKVGKFLREDFASFDEDNERYRGEVPPAPQTTQPPDTSADEVMGWTALFASQNYAVAADRFETCWEAALNANLLEMGAFHGWNQAKALYLQSLLGEVNARARSIATFERAIQRGGISSWFNRMRASLNRATQAVNPAPMATDYISVLFQVFDDYLERLGTTGTRFERFCHSLSDGLESENHGQFSDGLERLGNVLGYAAARPRHQGATDCRWRGSFGNHKELLTFEVKIEHTGQRAIALSDIGQAHNQLARAEGEHGYLIRGTIVTHMVSIEPAAEASAGSLSVLTKEAVVALWAQVRLVMSLYRESWSVDDMQARATAAIRLQGRVPQTGWLIRALDREERFITADHLLSEWEREP